MDGNINAGTRRFASDAMSAGRRLVVGSSGTAQQVDVGELFPAKDGVATTYTSFTNALADCRSGYDDKIDINSNMSTALTAAELLSAETNGVHVRYLGPRVGHTGQYITHRATASLPQGTTSALFTITGRVKLISIFGTVTTAIGAGANNTKLTLDPTAAGLSNTDICATLDIASDAVGTTYNITGTFATALVGASGGAAVFQAVPVTLEAGSLLLDCTGSNTGSVKWCMVWEPMDPGARVIAA